MAAPVGAAGPLNTSAAGPPTILTTDPGQGFAGFYAALSFGQIDGSVATPGAATLDEGESLGIVGGYNWQRGALVYGGEVRMTGVSGTTWPASGGIEAYEALFDLRGRAGYTLGDVMLYGSLGFSRGTATPTAPSRVETDGMTFGIGVEYNVSDRLFLGADVSRRDLSGAPDFDAEIDTLTLRGGFRF